MSVSCPTGLMHRSKRALFDHLIGASEQLIGTDSRTFLEPLSGLTVSSGVALVQRYGKWISLGRQDK